MPSKKEDVSQAAATLNADTQRALSQVLQDIRTTVAHLCVPGVSPLAVLDGTAVDALKDLYYIVNTEDPLNAMPARRLILEQRVVKSALLPLVNAVTADPSAQRNQKRWSVPMYQTLRLLSVLSIPIVKDNEFLRPGCNLDSHLLKLRADFAENRSAIHAFVALLQYYIERKAEKQAALAAAEESKLEDARTDNILRFFRNILSPPRPNVGEEITIRDKGVHLALVAALVDADFYSTISILFSSKEDAAAQYTDLVFLIADIYAQTYRHSTPRDMYQCYRKNLRQEEVIDLIKDDEQSEPLVPPKPASVFDEPSTTGAPEPSSVFDDSPPRASPKIPVRADLQKPSTARSKSSSIRAALLRERAYVGGSRAFTKSARWSSRFSGGLVAKPISPPNAENTMPSSTGHRSDGRNKPVNNVKNTLTKRVVSVRNAIHSRPSLNPLRHFQEAVKTNSDILCLLAAKGRTQLMKTQTKKSSLSNTMRKDLQEDGRNGIVILTTELVDVCFQHLMREMRERIEETKSRAFGDEVDALMTAQRAFLCILGSVVGFQREKYGKVFKHKVSENRPVAAELHENCMKSVLASDFKIVRKEWQPVEAGIDLETFRLVFRILIESLDSVKNDSKDDKKVQDVELSTFAILEMMKMLQGMTARGLDDDESLEIHDGDKLLNDIRRNKTSLTSREIALNTIEQLFEAPEYLNAPADLAKDYSSKVFSFRHLTNIVEVTHAFTTILLDEHELAHLQVARKKRMRTARKRNEEKSLKADAGEAEKDGDKPNSGTEGADKADQAITNSTENDTNGEEQPKKVASVESMDSDKLQEISEPWLTPTTSDGRKKSSEEAEPHVTNDSPTSITQAAADESDGIQSDPNLTTETVKGEAQEGLNENTDDGANHNDSASSDDDAPNGPELQEVESVGIIRRFAHAKAVQTLLIPIRVAICQASSLSGAVTNIPDGCGPLLSPVVTAKSAHVVAAVWRIAKLKERGAMCGQFFTYGTMHLLNIALEAQTAGSVLKDSVMERFSVLARDVTKSFFSWIALNPGMTLDVFFPMDKGSCHQYMTSARQRDAVLRDRHEASDSGNDSDASALALNRPGDLDFEQTERRISERNARKVRTNTQLRKKVVERRRERGQIEEDEDVDDLDNLNLGNGLESSDSSESDAPNIATEKPVIVKKSAPMHSNENVNEVPFCRLPASKRRRSRQTFDPFSSDDELLESRARKKRPKKPKTRAQPRRAKKQSKAKHSEKVFYSSDEYGAVDLNPGDSEQDGAPPQPEAPGQKGQEVRKSRLDWERSSQESDDSGAALETLLAASKDDNFAKAKESASQGLSHKHHDDDMYPIVDEDEEQIRVNSTPLSSSPLIGTKHISDVPQARKHDTKRRRLVLSDDEDSE